MDFYFFVQQILSISWKQIFHKVSKMLKTFKRLISGVAGIQHLCVVNNFSTKIQTLNWNLSFKDAQNIIKTFNIPCCRYSTPLRWKHFSNKDSKMLKTSKILCCRHSTPLHWIQCFHKDSNFKFEFEFKRCSKHSISCVAGIQHLCTTRWPVVGRRLPRSSSREAPTWVLIIFQSS